MALARASLFALLYLFFCLVKLEVSCAYSECHEKIRFGKFLFALLASVFVGCYCSIACLAVTLDTVNGAL